jgi:DNA repair exonuclease SbcCD ATPase subunit
MAKYLLIAAVALSLATAGIGFVNRGRYVETKETLAQTEDTLTKTKGTLATTQKELASTKSTLDTTTAEKEKFSADLASTQSSLKTAQDDLEKAKADAADKEAQVSALSEQNKQLEDKVAQIEANGGGGGGTTVQDTTHLQELEALVSSLQEKLKANEGQLATLQKKENDRQQHIIRKGLEGRVLAVNPAWNFVVLSLGDKQGVMNNAELLLKRNGQYLGKVRITSVEPSTSIADIVANSLPSGVAVQPGDSVIFQGDSTQD